MQHALSRFAELLRRDGIRVSPGELLDAAAITRDQDLTDRAALRDVLSITLVKRRDDQETFDRAFDRFFAPPAWGRVRKRRDKKRRGGEPSGEGLAAGEQRTGGGAPRGERPGAGRGQPRDPESKRRPPETPERSPTQSVPPRIPDPSQARSPTARAAEGLVAARLARLEELRRRPGAMRVDPLAGNAGARRLLRAPHRVRLDRAEDDARARGWHPEGSRIVARLSTKPFRDRWTSDEGDALAEELARLLARLRLRRTRRRRRARRGRLWIQRMVRANVGHDLVPFRLVHHAPRRREPRLVLAVDVSHSVARAASAFLTVVAGLTRSFRSVRVYFFVNDAVDVSDRLPFLRTLGGRTDALDAVVSAIPELNPYALSDYGRVLHQIAAAERGRIRRDTLLLILGDARTNRFDPAAWTLEELGERAAGVVWLVPEPAREWRWGDSAILDYAPYVDVLAETADLDGLRHALARVVPG